MTAADVQLSFKIEKATPTGRYVSGWLSVVEKDGKRIEDTQGDLISMDELRKGVHRYMRGERVIKKQHSGDKIGEMVEVMIIDDDVAKALGMTTTKRGAWGTAEITDPDVRKSVAAGEVHGWSMGGKGKRTPIAKAGKGLIRGGSRKLLRRTSDAYHNRMPGTWTMRGIRQGRKVMEYLNERKRGTPRRGSHGPRGGIYKSRGYFDRFL